MRLITLILAGGSGTRLWPASRAATPKQYLSFDGGPSYLQQALLRARAVSSDLVLVVTADTQVETVAAQAAALDAPPEAAPCYIVGEPAARNTAPAVALGAAIAHRATGHDEAEAALLVLSSDHAIEPEAAFAADVGAALRLTGEGWLTTFGIRPTRPETGYGYLELGDQLAGGYRVAAFREKPDHVSAERFLATGGYLWNAGMFLFPLPLLDSELRRHAPQVAELLSNPTIAAALPVPGATGGPLVVPSWPELRTAYDRLAAISIDYALMERSDRVAAVPASFRWSDVGSWDELTRITHGDPPVAAAEARGNAVFSDLPVALAGVDDLIVVVKNGAVLVTRKGRTQLVRDAVQALGERRPDLL